MNDYIRDKNGRALFFVNKSKKQEIVDKRELKKEVESLKDEINTLKKIVEELLAKRT